MMPNTVAQNSQIIFQSIDNIKLAISGKGVSVPAICPVDTISSLISDIGASSMQDKEYLKQMVERPNDVSIVIPYGTTSIAEIAFEEFRGLSNIVIPATVISIGQRAFSYCSGLSSITMPNSVVSIGNYSFANCTSLESVTLSNSLTDIGGNAFYNCTSLTSIEIPSSVTTIRYAAFQYCTSLMNVDLTAYANPNNIPTLSNASVFSSNASNRKFVVANAEMKAAFSAATNWSSYASAFITAEEAAQNA